VLQWLAHHFPEHMDQDRVARVAKSRNDVHCLSWLVEQGFSVNEW